MFTLIATHAHVTKFHHPFLHLNYPVSASTFFVYKVKRRATTHGKAAIFGGSLGFLGVRKVRRFGGSNGSFRGKVGEGDAELEAEIMDFMAKSEKPIMFPTKDDLLKAGRMDLVEAIKKRGGWYSLGWEVENCEEDVDFDTEEFQRRVVSCGESSSLREKDVNSVSGFGEDEEELSSSSRNEDINSPQPASSSGISLEVGADEVAGIEGILSRLQKQRNTDFGINLGKDDYGTYASSKDERDNRHLRTSSDIGIFNNSGGMVSQTIQPETWRTWSSQQAGSLAMQFEAAEISFSGNQVDRNREAFIYEQMMNTKENAEAFDGKNGVNQNQVQARLRHLELELTTALQLLRSKKERHISKEVTGSSSSTLQKVSDAWEFQENEAMNAKDKLRSIRAVIAVLEGKMALAMTDAEKIVEEKQKKIDNARRALQLLHGVCIVWPNSASEVLVAGSFDGWTTQRKMEKSKTGIFSVYLKLYPGRYEIKFIVDGIWKVDPLRPITHHNKYENNLLIIT